MTPSSAETGSHGASPAMRPAAPSDDGGDTIDAVVLWVDGDDPGHRAKLDRYLAQIGRRPVAARSTRFRSVGEIDFCLASILKFAPFIHRIHVVTDDQAGPIVALASHWPEAWRSKLALVDHRDIFAGHEQHLPSFNSLAIESLMHRVPGLARQFVYFNDDFMLIKPVKASDFFRQGKPVLHGRRMAMPDRRWDRRLRSLWHRLVEPRPGTLRASNTQAQALGARLAGAHKRMLLAGHSPYPLRRSTLEDYFAAHPQMLQRNASFQLRDPRQFAPTALANHLELLSDQAIVAPDDSCLYLKPASDGRSMRRILAAERDPRLLFACVQSLDEADAPTREQVLGWLRRVVSLDTVSA
jgi:hypothetical protein